jgi:hypothetical protein
VTRKQGISNVYKFVLDPFYVLRLRKLGPKLIYEIDARSSETSPCRTNGLSGGKLELICDSANLVQLPDVNEFPKNLTRFILNKTKVSQDSSNEIEKKSNCLTQTHTNDNAY